LFSKHLSHKVIVRKVVLHIGQPGAIPRINVGKISGGVMIAATTVPVGFATTYNRDSLVVKGGAQCPSVAKNITESLLQIPHGANLSDKKSTLLYRPIIVYLEGGKLVAALLNSSLHLGGNWT
jgi:hypothetical protein